MTGAGYWLAQVGRALSRLLCAVTGGEGDCTFSAWAWHRVRPRPRRNWVRRARVAVVNGLNRDRRHCARAWRWHAARGLLARHD